MSKRIALKEESGMSGTSKKIPLWLDNEGGINMRGKKLLASAATCLVLVFAVTETFAISITGSINFVSPPASVVKGGTQSDTQITFFTERNNFTLTSDLSVDIISAGTYSPTGTPPAPSNSGLTPGVITTGTSVNSFFLSLDPTINTTLTGSITFDSNIVGVIVSNPSLNGSDNLGAIGTTYPTGSPRQTLDSSVDSVILSSDFRTLTVNTQDQRLIYLVQEKTPSDW